MLQRLLVNPPESMSESRFRNDSTVCYSLTDCAIVRKPFTFSLYQSKLRSRFDYSQYTPKLSNLSNLNGFLKCVYCWHA